MKFSARKKMAFSAQIYIGLKYKAYFHFKFNEI